MRRVVSIVVMALVSFLLTACGGSGSSSPSAAPASATNNPSAPPASSSQPPAGGSSGGTSGTGSGSGSGTGSGSGSGSSGGGSGSSGSAQGGFVETKFPVANSGGMISADFNRDGHPDLLIYGSSLIVLLNNGSGNFGGSISIPLPASYTTASQVAVADFNADGYMDLVACVNNTSNGAAAIYLNDHSGKLVLGQVMSVPGVCRGVAAGDANRDGKPDFAIAYFTGTNTAPVNSIVTWLNDGSGHFAASTTQNAPLTATQDSTRNPCRMAAITGADFDGDGTLDLMLFGTCSSDVINPGDIYLARGDGTGHYVFTEISESNTSVYGSPLIMDINGDGKPDVVFTEDQEGPHASSASDLKFAINNGSGNFSLITAASESSYAGDGGRLWAGNSFDNANSAIEGFEQESCCAPPSTYGVRLFTQIGSAPTQTWTYGQAPSGSVPGVVTGIVSTDFDGNGMQDFAAVEQDANQNATLHVYLNLNK